ncbi:MAG: RNA polymerase sigma factor [Candidatus Zixiibacteriota bacterium]
MKLLRRGVSESLNYSGLFQSWEIAVAKDLVDEFQNKWLCLERDEFDDLLQEVLTHWRSKRDRYRDAGRASRKTFMGRVIRNKLTDLVRERESDKRKASCIADSLDEPIGNEEDSPTLADMIDESAVAGGSSDPFFRVDLGIDLSRALKKLTLGQRKLYHLLEKGFTVKEASEYLKTPRSTVYDELKRIGKLFEKEGLKEYLR